MPTARPKSSHEPMHIAFFREVLRDIRQVMTKNYGLTQVSVRPIKSDASRLSIPITISGKDQSGKPTRYFGKILGSNDILSDRSIQFFKNLYLQMNAQDPIFGFTETSEDMARQQYESLLAIYSAGIPTAKPLGFHQVNTSIWLLVAEFLETRSTSGSRGVTIEQIDTLCGYLRTLHGKGIFHGDIKTDNIMLGDKIYILDASVFREDAGASKKQAYDLACLICSFLDSQSVHAILSRVRKHYSRQDILDVVEYIDLIQQRQDFHFNDREKSELKLALGR
jgi:tRNA A-37 threonylcarbamoyl transferase component Bud32